MDEHLDNSSFFWINGSIIDLPTLEDFSEVSEDAIIRSLTGSSSQWGFLLGRSLCSFIVDMYLVQTDAENSKQQLYEKQSFAEFENQIQDLYALLAVAIAKPLAVWATKEEEVANAEKEYSLQTDPVFLKILRLSHLRHMRVECVYDVREMLTQIRKLEASYNKTRKAFQRNPNSGFQSNTSGLSLGNLKVELPEEI